MAKSKAKGELEVVRVRHEVIDFVLVGVTPLIFNRLSEKAKRELLLPAKRKTPGQKATTLKHDPVEEFRSSPHMSGDVGSPTLLQIPSVAFKSAMRSVAVDLDCDSSKSQLGRLTFVEGDYVPIWGIPELRMDIVRQAGMSRTPDVRTRACIREWVARLRVVYSAPILSETSIVNLMSNAGLMQGVGDGRPEKGKFSYGQWELADDDDDRVVRITAEGGRERQVAAMASPGLYDEETTELMEWFETEASARGLK